MSNYIFIFDLDSTITKSEILPQIAKRIGKYDEIKKITESTMNGQIPFKTSFLKRIEILNEIPVSEINKFVASIPINEHLIDFIHNNINRCFILTGNLDIWISGLMSKYGLNEHYYCSKAIVENDKISNIVSIVDKEMVAKQFACEFVSIGDGDNDAGMALNADISIGYGGVREIAPALLRCCDYAFYNEEVLSKFLRNLL